MMHVRLFAEPFDPDRIVADINDDDFLSLCFFVTGRRPNWRASVDQICRLFTLFESQGRDTAPLYRMLVLLKVRAMTLGVIDEFVAAIGILPLNSPTERIPDL